MQHNNPIPSLECKQSFTRPKKTESTLHNYYTIQQQLQERSICAIKCGSNHDFLEGNDEATRRYVHELAFSLEHGLWQHQTRRIL